MPNRLPHRGDEQAQPLPRQPVPGLRARGRRPRLRLVQLRPELQEHQGELNCLFK